MVSENSVFLTCFSTQLRTHWVALFSPELPTFQSGVQVYLNLFHGADRHYSPALSPHWTTEKQLLRKMSLPDEPGSLHHSSELSIKIPPGLDISSLYARIQHLFPHARSAVKTTSVLNRQIYHQTTSKVWWQQAQPNSTHVPFNACHCPWKLAGNFSATPMQFSDPRLKKLPISIHIAPQSSQINHPLIFRI